MTILKKMDFEERHYHGFYGESADFFDGAWGSFLEGYAVDLLRGGMVS